MTDFFAMPDETEAWVREIVEEQDLVRRDERFPSGRVQTLLWPADHEVPATVAGVLVQAPQLFGDILTMGVTGWKSSAFPEPTSS